MPRKFILSIILTLSLTLPLSSCTNSTSISSIEQLLALDEIISYEAMEVNQDHLTRAEEYNNNLLNQWNSDLELDKLETERELLPVDGLLCYKIRYKSDEEEVVGYIGLPTDYQDIDYPILIDNRGGNGDFGVNSAESVLYFARHGFIVMASQYRGADGGTGFDQFGGEDINDVIKLIDMAEMIDLDKDVELVVFAVDNQAIREIEQTPSSASALSFRLSKVVDLLWK